MDETYHRSNWNIWCRFRRVLIFSVSFIEVFSNQIGGNNVFLNYLCIYTFKQLVYVVDVLVSVVVREWIFLFLINIQEHSHERKCLSRLRKNLKWIEKLFILTRIRPQGSLNGLQDNSPRDNSPADNSPKNLNFFFGKILT